MRVSIAAYLPIPTSWSGKRQRMAERGLIKPTKRPDCDNYLKAALDSCNGIVFRDDSQIVDARVVKAYARKPRLEIRAEPLSPDASQPARNRPTPDAPVDAAAELVA